MPQVKPDIETFANIKVVGVGGSGGSAVHRMIQQGIRGVQFWAMNTDVQALHHNSAQHKLHLGKTITRGLGAGMDPEIGRRAAEESQNEIREALKDADMVFITCGLGGGTGTGAGPVVAEIAKDLGALTVAVVTKPFSFEGPQRKAIADRGYDDLASRVDTIITIPNDRVLQVIDKKTSLLDAFQIVDDVLRQGVQGISELITVPGIINVDFADVKTIMKDTGSALMGIGIGTGDNRAVEAANRAISSPLLDLSIDGARGILLVLTGPSGLGMQEVSEAAKIVTNSADQNARIIFGAVIDESMGEDVRVTVIATGFDGDRQIMHDKQREEGDSQKPKKAFYGSGIFGRKNFTSGSDMGQTPREGDSYNTPQPSRFTKEKPVQTADDIARQNFTRNPDIESPKPSSPSPSPTTPPSDANNKEDIEVPAFIRRRLG